jgi:diacylglycerol diphosphate phosphatase/phosphatidate phosphatase
MVSLFKYPLIRNHLQCANFHTRLIGGLRPHFLAVCKPDPTKLLLKEKGEGYGKIYFRPDICTGNKKEINDSLESWPSGHTTAAFAGFVFLSLYLNGKLKVFSNYHPRLWKLIVVWAPILGATLIGGSLTIDEYHHWYDVVSGAIIGTVFAFSAYRMVYASVWDFRFNHIPLARRVPFTYGLGSEAFEGFHDAIFTRKAGWGDEGSLAAGGAPFDAVHRGGISASPHAHYANVQHRHSSSGTSSSLSRRAIGGRASGEPTDRQMV